MNLKLHTLLVALICLTASPEIRATNPDSHLLFSISSESKARLGIVNLSRRSIKLEILNQDEVMLFDRTVSGYENFFQLLDLSGMPDGDYTVRLTRNIGESEEKNFIIEKGVATLVVEKKEIPPVFRLVDDNSLIISYLNAKSNSVNVFFEYNDEVVFEDRGIRESPVSKRYSLAKLPKGNYVVKLYSGGKIYDFSMTIN